MRSKSLSYSLRIFLIIYYLIFVNEFSQKLSVQPTKLPGSNSISFDKGTNKYKFYFNKLLCYEYSILPDTTSNGGTFNVLRAYSSDGTSFLPSNFGGIRVKFGNSEVYPWDNGVSFILLDHQILQDDTVQVYWQMNAHGESIKYKYKFKISGRTLVIHVEVDNEYANNVVTFELDRCEEASDPAKIEIPCLPLFHVLFANNMFTTFFADWEVSNASQIIPSDGSTNSNSSIRYSQTIKYNPKTNNQKNRMDEKLYLTTSWNLEDVLPNIPNPVSPYKDTCANYIVWDVREPFSSLISPSPARLMEKLYEAGVRNIWVQVHTWQHAGYDQELPCVLPPNPKFGGTEVLKAVINKARSFGYRVGLHQNYVDYYPNAKCRDYGYNPSDVALNSSGNFIKAYKNGSTQSYLLKPSRSLDYLEYWSKAIQDSFPKLNGSYLDVASSLNSSIDYVDYDTTVINAGMFRETLNKYRELYLKIKENNKGPVQGEGGNQPFYQGYADDIEARLVTPTNWSGGFNLPLLIDFDMLKLRDKAFIHGAGYINTYTVQKKMPPNTEDISVATDQTSLAYIATELAYGHGGYLPTASSTYNIIEYAQLVYRFVFSIQKDIADAIPVSILYNDNGNLKTASDYIRSHPLTYKNINSPDFMGQVRVEYDNGIIIYVNRHPSRSWDNIDVGLPNGWFNYNANGKLETGTSSTTTFNLPVNNGWVVYDPLK